MKIIITGACGLIGKKLYSKLAESGHDVICMGRSICSSLENTKSFIKVDLSEQEMVNQVANELPNDIDVIIHCAAQQPRLSLSFTDYRKGNIDTTENVIYLSKKLQVRSLISFSTVAFLDFPIDEHILVTESSHVNPLNYYGLSKLTAEYLLKTSVGKDLASVDCFRIPSLVQEEQIGGMVYTYFDSAHKNLDLEIYDNGKYLRNLIYIDSILELISTSIEHTQIKKGFNLYNLGTSDSWTMMGIAEYIYKKTNSTGKVIPVDKACNVPGHWNISVKKAVRDIGFKPWSTKQVLDSYIKNMIGEIH